MLLDWRLRGKTKKDRRYEKDKEEQGMNWMLLRGPKRFDFIRTIAKLESTSEN